MRLSARFRWLLTAVGALVMALIVALMVITRSGGGQPSSAGVAATVGR